VPDQPQPRRRTTDRDRRRWSDDRLDDFRETTERRLDDLERFERLVAQVPGLMQGVKEQLEETQKDVRELRSENRQAHTRVEQKVDTTVDQTTRSPMKDFLIAALAAATGIGVPIMLAQVLH
jgi:chromosome segregation ATPase